ncbi:hypothetical protein CPAR01_03304 [Colletotrichum paranaense]|uniref:C2H2-type domain-containing protein n=1 Tax=Colletotrichum paranaense TaxID=1914294 RepID=A0ABQ9T1Y6_9PEZI|nr:uncharacterized protein CPAR01_03304 [Colletotrichum paranaense]KAK1545802.1 hypothetical protein CPAR01_03304 [Colletotrichum paranaense]
MDTEQYASASAPTNLRWLCRAPYVENYKLPGRRASSEVLVGAFRLVDALSQQPESISFRFQPPLSMSLLLRFSSGLIVNSDTVANRLSTVGGNSLGQSSGPCTVVDVCSTATDALGGCPTFFDSLFSSLSSQLNHSHVQLSPAGVAVLQTPSRHLGPTLAQHTCSQWPVFKIDDVKVRHGLYNLLAVCGTGLYLLKPVAVVLFAKWVPAALCPNENPSSQISGNSSTGWRAFSDLLARPTIPQLLRELYTAPGLYLKHLVYIPKSSTTGGGSEKTSGSGGVASGTDQSRRRKRATKSSGSTASSTTSRGRGEKRPRVAVAPKAKAVRKGRLFACHFYAHDTVAHECCRHYKFDEVRDIRRHLTEEGRGNHRQPIHCVICFSLFTTFAERSAHIRSQTCRPGVCDFDASGLNEDQIASIRGLKKSRSDDQKEFWFKIWDIIFPGEQRPASPYSEDVDELATRRRVAPRMVVGVQQLGLQLGWSDHDVQAVIRVLDSSWGQGPGVPPSTVEQHNSSQAANGTRGPPSSPIQNQVFSGSAPTAASLMSPPNSLGPTNITYIGGSQPRSTLDSFQSPYQPFNAPRDSHQARAAHISYNLALMDHHSSAAQQHWTAHQTNRSGFRTNPMLNTTSPQVHYAAMRQTQSRFNTTEPGVNVFPQGLNQPQPANNPVITDNWARLLDGHTIASDNEGYQSPSNLLPPEHCECRREPGRSPRPCFLHC